MSITFPVSVWSVRPEFQEANNSYSSCFIDFLIGTSGTICPRSTEGFPSSPFFQNAFQLNLLHHEWVTSCTHTEEDNQGGPEALLPIKLPNIHQHVGIRHRNLNSAKMERPSGSFSRAHHFRLLFFFGGGGGRDTRENWFFFLSKTEKTCYYPS